MKQRLSRLVPQYYQGDAWAHWTLTIAGRRRGWLDARFLYKFRELLTHACFRSQVACPIYTLMPDHIHLLWCGLAMAADQRVAMKRFRADTNETLKRIGFEFQLQPYDHVLRDEELERDAIENVVEYIARNPERKELVPIDQFASYPYTGCLLPGFPQIRLFEPTSWDTVWRTLAFLKRIECYRVTDPKRQPKQSQSMAHPRRTP